MKRLKNNIQTSFPKAKLQITYKGTRLSSKFNIKDTRKIEHEHDVVYEAKCPDCTENYVGETGRRLTERVKEHSKDTNSHLLRHSLATGHKPVTLEDFKILGKGYRNYYRRKVSEAILIQKNKPTLNKQDMSVPINLFN